MWTIFIKKLTSINQYHLTNQDKFCYLHCLKQTCKVPESLAKFLDCIDHFLSKFLPWEFNLSLLSPSIVEFQASIMQEPNSFSTKSLIISLIRFKHRVLLLSLPNRFPRQGILLWVSMYQFLVEKQYQFALPSRTKFFVIQSL